MAVKLKTLNKHVFVLLLLVLVIVCLSIVMFWMLLDDFGDFICLLVVLVIILCGNFQC